MLPSAPFATDESLEQTNGNGRTTSSSLREACDELAAKVNAFLEAEAPTDVMRAVQKQTIIAIEVIHKALETYKLEEMSISYNGGKDCLVLLVIYLAALSPTIHLSPTRTSHPLPSTFVFPPSLESIHIIPPDPFPEVLAFVNKTSTEYCLSLTHSSLPMRPAFAAYLSSHPSIRAILVGTRRTDPHGHSLTHFDPTDHGWPAFMRIHPVIDWHYQEIWAFIRVLDVAYCSLYDKGYTSLGGTKDTKPNPVLSLVGDGKGGGEGNEIKFKPAYELVSDEAERLGRD